MRGSGKHIHTVAIRLRINALLAVAILTQPSIQRPSITTDNQEQVGVSEQFLPQAVPFLNGFLSMKLDLSAKIGSKNANVDLSNFSLTISSALPENSTNESSNTNENANQPSAIVSRDNELLTQNGLGKEEAIKDGVQSELQSESRIEADPSREYPLQNSSSQLGIESPTAKKEKTEALTEAASTQADPPSEPATESETPAEADSTPTESAVEAETPPESASTQADQPSEPATESETPAEADSTPTESAVEAETPPESASTQADQPSEPATESETPAEADSTPKESAVEAETPAEADSTQADQPSEPATESETLSQATDSSTESTSETDLAQNDLARDNNANTEATNENESLTKASLDEGNMSKQKYSSRPTASKEADSSKNLLEPVDTETVSERSTDQVNSDNDQEKLPNPKQPADPSLIPITLERPE